MLIASIPLGYLLPIIFFHPLPTTEEHRVRRVEDRGPGPGPFISLYRLLAFHPSLPMAVGYNLDMAKMVVTIYMERKTTIKLIFLWGSPVTLFLLR